MKKLNRQVIRNLLPVCFLIVFLNSYAQLIVDQSVKFDKPIKSKATFFVELIPSDLDSNNVVDQLLVLSEGPVSGWEDYSVAVRFSSNSWFIDVRDDDHFSFREETKIGFEIGQVYQCWISVDVMENSYSLHVKTIDQDGPVLIWEGAGFRKKVTKLTQWSRIHNKSFQNDPLLVKGFAEVKKVGAFPKGYVPDKVQDVFSIEGDGIPKNAVVIESPKHGMQKGSTDLVKIVLTDQSTSLYFHTTFKKGYWIRIPEETFISPVSSGEKLKIMGSEGITIGNKVFISAKGYQDYKLVFPPISPGVALLDFGESNSKGNWFIYDIELKETMSTVASPLVGNWFNDITGDWELSFLEEGAVYNQKVWNYDGEMPDDQEGVIKLVQDDLHVSLYYEINKKGKLLIGEDKNKLISLDHDSRYANVSSPTNPPLFQDPVFKPDTAVFSGYLYGYTSRVGTTTGSIIVDNIFTGEQKTHMIKIQENGYFSVKVPMVYSEEVWVRMEFGGTRLFLTPGETVFVLMNLKEKAQPLVMGANARLINELMVPELDVFQKGFWNDVNDVILDMSPEEYKAYCLNRRDKELQQLDSLSKKYNISDRFLQMTTKKILLSYARNILHYKYNAQSAYRQKYNVPRSQRKLPVAFELPSDPGFYDFIDDGLVNAPLNSIATVYDNFLNAFMYSAPLQQSHVSMSLIDFKELVTRDPDADEGHLTFFESALINDEALSKLQDRFMEEYSEDQNNLIREHIDFYKTYSKEHKGGPGLMKGFLQALNESDSLSGDQRLICDQLLNHYTNPQVVAMEKFTFDNREVLESIQSKYQVSMNLLSYVKRAEKRNEILKSMGIEEGLASDIMLSQEVLRMVESEFTPLSPEQMNEVKGHFRRPFIPFYIEEVNKSTRAAIEANKSKKGYVLNDVPQTKADQVFEAIVSKYQGKVVYVDFWATWCGPCRSSMSRQKPMKEKLKDKDVVFLYITNQSSPEKTYKNMIPNIKGEHYRVSSDEWNYLSEKFNISGIPHYAIVNKSGEVIDPDASRDPGVLMNTFSELLAE